MITNPRHRKALFFWLCWLFTVSACATARPSAERGVTRGGRSTPPARVAATASAADGLTTLVEIRSTRFVSMHYKLDLREFNAHAPGIAAPLDSFDPDFRQCYADRLDDRPALRGTLMLKFWLPKGLSTMRAITQTGGSLRDEYVSSCVQQRLGRISFNAPRDLAGSLVYLFDVSAPDKGQAR